MNLENDNLVIIDPELDERIKSYRKAEFQLEEILSDPMLGQGRAEAANIVCSYLSCGAKKRNDTELFIKSAISEWKEEISPSSEIKEIKSEIRKNNIDELSAEWVREWHRKKQSSVSPSPADDERKKFIAASLENNAEQDSKINQPDRTVHRIGSKTIYFAGLAAAAGLALLITFKSLMPVASSELYNINYRSFNAVGAAIRGSSDLDGIYNEAINDYKSGNYLEAEEGFRKSSENNPANGASLFYLGMAQLENGKTEEAINNLKAVMDLSGSYAKESCWYLGLAYLKSGNEAEAKKCFGKLASADGFYRKPSEKILRRLK